MLRGWVEFLPLILVRKIADSECERTYLHGRLVVIPRPGVMIEADERPAVTHTGPWTRVLA